MKNSSNLEIKDNFAHKRAQGSLFSIFFIPGDRVGFYSSWGCIFSTLVFDWGSIIISEGWGCIQEWGCIQADTVDIKQIQDLVNFQSHCTANPLI